jgi:hypothetical protein
MKYTKSYFSHDSVLDSLLSEAEMGREEPIIF